MLWLNGAKLAGYLYQIAGSSRKPLTTTDRKLRIRVRVLQHLKWFCRDKEIELNKDRHAQDYLCS
jgi:hypothetical protein